MKLSDLRKVTIKRNLRIRFRLPNGMECVLNEHGIAQIPSLKSVPDFNLEEELAGVNEFLLEPVASGGSTKSKAISQTLDRQQLAAMAGGGGASHDEPEE